MNRCFQQFILTSFLLFSVNVWALLPVKIPDPSLHRPFLLGEWQNDRSNLVIFIDPLCPYCKKAVAKFKGITEYNLFVFWSPIFGERSELAIKPFFHCERPTQMVLLLSLLNKEANTQLPDCHDNYNTTLRMLNDEMVASYSITSVPAFYRQGVRTSLSAVYKPVSTATTPITATPIATSSVNGVAINWQRYKPLKTLSGDNAKTKAIVFPKEFGDEKIKLLETFRPAYVFSATKWEKICEYPALKRCLNKGAFKRYQYMYREFTTLLGLDDQIDSVRVISNNGEITTIK